MTYQNSSEQFSSPDLAGPRFAGTRLAGTRLAGPRFAGTRLLGRVLAPLGRFFSAIGTTLVKIGESSPRLRRVEALQAKSDAELAQLGIRRDEIVQVVFGNCYYI